MASPLPDPPLLRTGEPAPDQGGRTTPLLKVFGLVDHDAHPSQAEVTELRIMAYLLLVMLSYDCVIWTVAANLILFGSQTGVYTAISAAAATLLAVTFSIFERTLLISPTQGRVPALVLAYTARLAMVLLGALITALPLELVVFGDSIDRRLLAEWQVQQVLIESRNYAKVLDDSVTRLTPSVRNDLANEKWWQECLRTDARMAASEKALGDLESERAAASEQRTSVTARLNTLEKQIAQRDAGGTALLERSELSSRLATIENAGAQAARREDGLRKQVETIQAEGVECERRFQENIRARAVVDSALERQEAQKRVDALRSALPESNPATQASFLERVVVVRELARGRPVMVTDEEVTLVQETLQIDLRSFVAVRGEPWVYSTIFMVFFGIGFLVPSVGMTYKLAMPEILSQYFQRRAPTRGGIHDDS